MHILVTGGCGFIGSHVVDALIARGDTVHVLDDLSTGTRENLNKAASFTQGDVADDALFATLAADADGIIHLAAIASVPACEANWLHSHRTNAYGTVCALNAARLATKRPRVVYASSAAVYGDTPDLPLHETAAANPISVYGMDKWLGEREAAIAHARFGVDSVGLRFFNVFGPRQDPSSPYSGVISIFANAAKRDMPISIFGDGEQTRDFICVADIVHLILAALNAPAGAHVINGCTGRATSLNQLAAHLRTIAGVSLPATHSAERSGDIRHSVGSPDAAIHLLNFHASTPFDDGLRQLWGWIAHE